MSKRYLILPILAILALCAAPTLAASDACLCTCTTQSHGSGEQYYELDGTGGCAISGPCVYAGHRGKLSNCVKAPKPIDTSASLATISTEEFLAYLNERFGP